LKRIVGQEFHSLRSWVFASLTISNLAEAQRRKDARRGRAFIALCIFIRFHTGIRGSFFCRRLVLSRSMAAVFLATNARKNAFGDGLFFLFLATFSTFTDKSSTTRPSPPEQRPTYHHHRVRCPEPHPQGSTPSGLNPTASNV